LDKEKSVKESEKDNADIWIAGQLPNQPLNKFYVGAEHIGEAYGREQNAPNTKATLGEAIEDARKVLNDNPRRNTVVIVQITHVVRRKRPPIVVEEV
jgi:hypothetical protein